MLSMQFNVALLSGGTVTVVVDDDVVDCVDDGVDFLGKLFFKNKYE